MTAVPLPAAALSLLLIAKYNLSETSACSQALRPARMTVKRRARLPVAASQAGRATGPATGMQWSG